MAKSYKIKKPQWWNLTLGPVLVSLYELMKDSCLTTVLTSGGSKIIRNKSQWKQKYRVRKSYKLNKEIVLLCKEEVVGISVPRINGGIHKVAL